MIAALFFDFCRVAGCIAVILVIAGLWRAAGRDIGRRP